MARDRESAQVHVNATLVLCYVEDAIGHLRQARDLLVRAAAPKAADKVRHAIKSAEGAARNASSRRYRNVKAEIPQPSPQCPEVLEPYNVRCQFSAGHTGSHRNGQRMWN